MGFVRLAAPQLRGSGRPCLNAQHLAFSAATFTLCSSVVVVLVYLWRLVLNARHPDHLSDVYYGVQISYLSTLGTHVTLIALTSVLFIGIRQERCGLITPWVVANIAFMALEAVCCMYSNVLRDHVNKRFDAVCRAEVSFFLFRVIINAVGLWAVMRFVRNIRAGFTYKEPDAIEL